MSRSNHNRNLDEVFTSMDHKLNISAKEQKEIHTNVMNKVKRQKPFVRKKYTYYFALTAASILIFILIVPTILPYLEDNDSKIVQSSDVQERIDKLQQQISDFELEKENFAVISNLSREFVRAHNSGDKEKLRQLLSDDITLVERDNTLYAVLQDDYEWHLYSYDTDIQLEDWVIQGYAYDSGTKTYSIFIREFYIDNTGESVSPPTFLGLTFELINDEWKVISLGFDV